MLDRPFVIRLLNTVEPVTTFYRDLIPFWEALGWLVEVFISRAEYRSGRKPIWISKHTKVHWTTSLGQRTNNRFGKLTIMITYMISTAIKTLFGRSVNRNLFLTQPPLFFLWGYVLKRLRKQAYYIVLMDLYPEVAIQAGVLSPHSFAARLLTSMSHFGLRHADGVIVIGRHMRQRVSDMGVHSERIHLIPNWTDEEVIFRIPPDINEFRSSQDWQDKFVVMYSGNMGTAHHFADLLEVCRRLRSNEEIVFAFIGGGQRRNEIEEFKKKHDLDNIVLLPFQPQEKLAETLGAGDLHFVSLQTGYTGLVVPSKIYGILAVGLPTLYQGESWGEIAGMLEEEEVGVVVPLESPDDLERQIMAYCAISNDYSDQSRRARELAEGHYSKHRACERYTAVLAPYMRHK